MSRTDKTRPVFVKLADHPVEIHDHRNGACELLADPHRVQETGDFVRGACYLDAQWWRREFRCCCTLCGGGFWARQERRQERRRGRAAARNWDREYR